MGILSDLMDKLKQDEQFKKELEKLEKTEEYKQAREQFEKASTAVDAADAKEKGKEAMEQSKQAMEQARQRLEESVNNIKGVSEQMKERFLEETKLDERRREARRVLDQTRQRASENIKNTTAYKGFQKASEAAGERLKSASERVEQNETARSFFGGITDTITDMFGDTRTIRPGIGAGELPPNPEEKAKREKEAAEAAGDNPTDAYQGPGAVAYREKTGWEKRWEAFKEDVGQTRTAKTIQGAMESLKKSENPVVSAGRGLFYTVQDKVDELNERMFPETEQAMALAAMKERMPDFSEDKLLSDVSPLLMPLVETTVKGGAENLKYMLSEEAYRSLNEMYVSTAEFENRSRILEIGDVEYVSSMFTKGRPTFIIKFSVQRTVDLRDKEGNPIYQMAEDEVQKQDYLWYFRHDSQKDLWVVEKCMLVHAQRYI